MTGPFRLPPLPFEAADLAPLMSVRTLEFHHGKHHATYIDNLNRLVTDTAHAELDLDQLVLTSAATDNRALFNNAAQAWNHGLFWHSLSPTVQAPDPSLAADLAAAFGDLARFKQQMATAAVGQFGSGWAWLTWDRNAVGGGLRIETTANADTPLAHGRACLLVIDVWEHAYYLDYQNRRADYAAALVERLNWAGAAERLAQARGH